MQKALKTRKARGFPKLKYFLEEAFLPEDGFLCFKSTGRYDSLYVADEDDGTVQALEGKWYESDEIAA